MMWGKLMGALIGFKVGGPLGALVGLIVGHWLDTKIFGRKGKKSPPVANSRATERQTVFLTSVVNLAAKLSKIDGVVTRDEVNAFKACFSIPASDSGAIGAIYDEARRDPSNYEIHARRLAEVFAGEQALLGQVLDALQHIALADGRLQPTERDFLQRVAVIFGFPGRRFADAANEVADGDPYAVLGVARAAPMSEIKAAWRRLTREHHPDTLMAKGMPPEFIEVATRKMAAINAAYDSIRTERGEA